MKVVTLGTGSPIPDANRAGPATLVRAAGRDFLFDCGRGVVMRLAGAWSGPAQLDRLLLTHLHSDHICDFNDVLTTRWVMAVEPSPLRVIGPVGTAGFVERTLEMLRDDIGYRRAHHDDLNWDPPVEVTEVAEGVVLEDATVRITAAPTDHAPVHPTVGYRIEADGKVAVIAGDTIPCDGLSALCAGADVYVQTVIQRAIVESIPMARLQDILGYHSSVEDAARTATASGVATLVLTHVVPAPPPGGEAALVDLAQAAGFDGEVVIAADLTEIDT